MCAEAAPATEADINRPVTRRFIEKSEARDGYVHPSGEILADVKFGDQVIEIIAPDVTNNPIDSGLQVQVIDRSLNVEELGENPLLSPKLDVTKYLRVEAVAALAAQRLFESSPYPIWVNINTRTYPPLNPVTGGDTPQQYHCLVVDIQCQRIPSREKLFKRYNKVRGRIHLDHFGRMVMAPNAFLEQTPISGIWGQGSGIDLDTLESLEKELTASPEDIKSYQRDPHGYENRSRLRMLAIDENDSYYWKQNPTGTTQYYGRRTYKPVELRTLKHMISDGDIETIVEDKLKECRLFTDEQEDHPEYPDFLTNEVQLWRSGIQGKGRYRIVTLRVPSIDASEGINFKVELTPPEPDTAWENLENHLSMRALAIGLTRIIKQAGVSIAPIPDFGVEEEKVFQPDNLFIDGDINWKLRYINDLYKDKPDIPELKRRISKFAISHLHVQMPHAGVWLETPPMAMTFRDHDPLTHTSVENLQNVLNNSESGLTPWIRSNVPKSIL